MAISTEIPLRTIDSEIDPRVELSDEHLVNPTIEPSADNQEQTAEKAHYGRRFWSIFTGLSLTALLSALDGSIVSTAVPTIVGDLNAGENYIWVINIYFLTR